MKGDVKMKKTELIWGFVYMLFGLACLLAAMFTDSRLDGFLFGFSGAGLGPGLMMIFRYFYWNSEKNRDKYRELLENQRIERNDELKERLRDKSGRRAYILGILIVCLSIMVFSLLDALGIVEGRLMVIYLGGYLAVQLAAGIIIFNRLLKKY